MLNLVLKYPKLIAGGIIATALIGFFWHYTNAIDERDQLRVEKTAFQAALVVAARNFEIMEADALRAAEATVTANRERAAAHAALDAFRAGREDDPEAHAWGEQLVPLGELARLCVALPEMNGCPDTPRND